MTQELANALDQSYRGIIGGRDLDGAHIGDHTKQWTAPIELARNYAPPIVGDGTWAEVRRFPTGSPVPVMSQPEDFRVRDLGTGESVMEIERVRDVWPNVAIAGVSTWEGKPAVRLIPTNMAADASWVDLGNPIGSLTPPDQVVTLLGTLHQRAVISGSLNIRRGRATLRNDTNYSDSALSPNEPGSYEHRVSGPVGALNYEKRAILYHGGTQGSGDVWWTDIGLFAGEYDGPHFDLTTTPPDTIVTQAPTGEAILWGWAE